MTGAPGTPQTTHSTVAAHEKWAVVTGASSGIGAAIAEQLAGLGWNVVLIGRDEKTLSELATRLNEKNIQARILSADLSTMDGIERVKALATQEKLGVGILVNNAGFGIHSPFIESNSTDELRMIDLQLKATLELTRAFLPGMLERKLGYVLNVASVYAFSPVPNQAVYAACKSFMLSFSRTLALELHNTGVSVSVLCPGITLTQFRTRAGMKEKKSSFAMTADAVAAIGVSGMMRRRLIIVPGWHNKLYTTLASCLPSGMLGRFTRWFNRKRGIAHGKPNA